MICPQFAGSEALWHDLANNVADAVKQTKAERSNERQRLGRQLEELQEMKSSSKGMV